MKNKLFLVLTSVLILVSAAACAKAPVINTTVPQVRTINASGTGEVYIVPDIASINIGVRAEAEEVAAALDENNAQSAAVAEAVKALGVEAKDIQTSSFYIYQMKDYDNMGQVTRTYFVVENSVHVIVRDLAKLGDMLDGVVRAGANTINSITFDLENKDASMAEARDKAIKDAIAEAEAIAAASGVKLGELQTVNVYTDNNATPVYEARGGGAMMDAASSVPVSSGQIVVTATASLVYAIK